MRLFRFGALLALAATAACRTAGMYEPVPVRLGEPVVIGADTVYRVSASSYQLVAGRREALPDVKQALDLAVIRWRGFFRQDPPQVTVLMRDSVTRRVDERALRGLGRGSFVGLGRPAPEEDPSRRPVRAGAPPAAAPMRRALAEPVAEAWVAAFVDSLRDGRAGRAGSAREVPDWLRTGIVELVATAGLPEVAASRLSRDEDLPTLAALFGADIPAAAAAPAGDGDRRPRRRTIDEALEDPRERFRIQSALVVQFLIERGGLTAPGTLLAAFAEGADTREALRRAGVTPASAAELEEPWRDWLEDLRAPGRR